MGFPSTGNFRAGGQTSAGALRSFTFNLPVALPVFETQREGTGGSSAAVRLYRIHRSEQRRMAIERRTRLSWWLPEPSRDRGWLIFGPLIPTLLDRDAKAAVKERDIIEVVCQI